MVMPMITCSNNNNNNNNNSNSRGPGHPPQERGPRAAAEAHRGVYYTIRYYTILYYTIRYYTILYYTIREGRRGRDPGRRRAPREPGHLRTAYIYIYIYIERER